MWRRRPRRLARWFLGHELRASRLWRAFMPESQVSDASGGRLRISLNIQICSSPDSAGRRQRGRRIYGRRGGRAARRQPRRPECSAGATGGATRGFWYVLIMISYGMDIHIPQRARSLAAPARTGRERGREGVVVAVVAVFFVARPLSVYDPLACPLGDSLTISP